MLTAQRGDHVVFGTAMLEVSDENCAFCFSPLQGRDAM